MEQVHPEMVTLEPDVEAALLAALHLRHEDLMPGQRPKLAFNGDGRMLVPIRNEAVLVSLDPDQEALARLSTTLKIVGFYCFVVKSGERHAAVRMFAPAYGIPEEAATGMMAGPLGFWLSRVAGLPGLEFRIEQGRLMKPASPSLLDVRLEDSNLWVGGRAKGMRHLECEVNRP